MKSLIYIITSILISFTTLASDHQQITVTFNTKLNTLEGHLRLSPSGPENKLVFYLHKDLKVKMLKGLRLTPLRQQAGGTQVYQVELGRNREVELAYSGRIYNDLSSPEGGFISEKGIVLFTSSFWSPYFENRYFSFDLKVSIDQNDWQGVSQGNLVSSLNENGESSFHWRDTTPQIDLYFMAAKFHKYSLSQDNIEASVYLRSEDDKLAQSYLGITHQHIKTFSDIIGAYPYGKFATIENLWETGYGMPSFTLLGPSVIRLPFLLYSSFPHEILHNWWGNGVYVDYDNGNWCEGLTTYMSDHFFQNMRGKGAEYRRTALQNYRNYVTKENEFSLREFKGRHNSSSQAIGYGKAMMFFHMLKIQLGEENFNKTMQTFYQDRLFKVSSYEDIRAAAEKVSGLNLRGILNQWVDRIGAPKLSLESVEVNETRYTISLKQNNSQSYQLFIPIELVSRSGKVLKREVVHMRALRQSFDIKTNREVREIRIDPNYDVFRWPLDEELPPALSGIYGEKKKTVFVLPSVDEEAYRTWISSFRTRLEGEIQVVSENEISSLPKNSSVWVLGQNKWKKNVSDFLKSYHVRLTQNEVRFSNQQVYSLESNDLVLAIKSDTAKTEHIGYVSLSQGANPQRLAQKMVHYGKYGLIIFEGEKNLKKHSWPVVNSPLNYQIP